MTRPIVLHLVDDTNPGGVMRLLEFLNSSETLQDQADHQILKIKRGTWVAPKCKTSLIISHLSVSWRTLPFFFLLKSRNPKATLIHFEHTYSHAFFKNEVSSQGRFLTLLRTTYSLFDKVISVSKAQARWLDMEKLVSPSRLKVISPCVSLEPFLSLPAPKTWTNFGAIGRLSLEKGFDLLIDAFILADMPNAKLHIFGDGPERKNLEARAKHPGILFHGFVGDPVEALKEIDIVAMPSKRETYGLVAIEAMAAGRTLLVSGVDGLQDHVECGAIKVPQPTKEAWAQALKDSLKPDPKARTRARQLAKQSETRFFSGWHELIERELF